MQNVREILSEARETTALVNQFENTVIPISTEIHERIQDFIHYSIDAKEIQQLVNYSKDHPDETLDFGLLDDNAFLTLIDKAELENNIKNVLLTAVKCFGAFICALPAAGAASCLLPAGFLALFYALCTLDLDLAKQGGITFSFGLLDAVIFGLLVYLEREQYLEFDPIKPRNLFTKKIA